MLEINAPENVLLFTAPLLVLPSHPQTEKADWQPARGPLPTKSIFTQPAEMYFRLNVQLFENNPLFCQLQDNSVPCIRAKGGHSAPLVHAGPQYRNPINLSPLRFIILLLQFT